MQLRVDTFPMLVGGNATTESDTIESSKRKEHCSMNIADRIQSLRKIKGISQEELADKIGVTRQAVSKWESEQSIPDMEKVILLSDYFEVTTDYLLKGIEETRESEKKKNIGAIFNIVATALTIIGVLIAIFLWIGRQKTGIIVAGLVFIVLGIMIFAVGQSQLEGREKTVRMCQFWKINVWWIGFLGLSLVYNILVAQVIAPFPMIFLNRIIEFAIFVIVYLVVCVGTTVVLHKKGKA